MSQRVLGIDLGTYSVKVTWLEKAQGRLVLTKALEQPLALHTRLSHEELCGLALEAIAKSNDMTADHLAVSVPGIWISNRIQEFPFTQIKKIQQAMEFQLEGLLPFEMDEMHIDGDVLEKTESQSKVLLSYVRRERFQSLLNSLEKAGLDPRFMGADATDLSHIALTALVPLNTHYMICDIGHSKTNLIIMNGRQMRYVRTLGVGGIHFTRAIQRTFNLNYDKAEAMKLSRGRLIVKESEQDQVSRILGNVAKELVSGIKQTLLGFESTIGPETIHCVCVTGGGSRLVGLMETLSYHLRQNVMELDGLHGLDHNLPDTTLANGTFLQAIAASLRPLYPLRTQRINFRKGLFAFKRDLNILTNELKAVAILVALVVGLGAGYYFYSDMHFSHKKKLLDQYVTQLVVSEMPELKPAGKGGAVNVAGLMRSLSKRYASLAGDVRTLSGQNRLTPVAALDAISASLPVKKDVYFQVNDFTFTDDFLSLDAVSNDPLNFQKIVDELRKNKIFESIETMDPQSLPNNVWRMTMKLNLKALNPEESDQNASVEEP